MDHMISAEQFQPDNLQEVFDLADEMAERRSSRQGRRALTRRHVGYMAATLFYEPSTRTRLSFEAAVQHLGMGLLSTENAGQFSSAVKGETLEDTIRTVGEYADLIIMRHKEKGAAARAAAVSEVPIINAGDGDGEHPTQAGLDLYTILKEKERMDNLNVVLIGDLKKGRTARSLSLLLSKFPGNHITGVSLPELRMGDDIKERVRATGTTYEESEDLPAALASADVVYATRLQLERHQEQEGVEIGKNFIIDAEMLQYMQPGAIILHPLPRNNEIAVEVDTDKRAKYFDQVKYGLHFRMSLTDLMMTRALRQAGETIPPLIEDERLAA